MCCGHRKRTVGDDERPSAEAEVMLNTRTKVAVGLLAAAVLIAVTLWSRDDGGTARVTAIATDGEPASTSAADVLAPDAEPPAIENTSTTSFDAVTTTTGAVTAAQDAIPTPASDPPSVTTISGTANWATRDPRGDLRVGACPASDPQPACPHLRTVEAAADGAFTLALPADVASTWLVAAYVIATPGGCVFHCQWRGAQAGPTTSVSIGDVPAAVELTVSARVVDVLVRDRNGQPFEGGGVQASDLRCTDDPPDECRGEHASMFVRAAGDGSTRLVLDPTAHYELHGQATNTGWPDPAWTHEGSTFWFSPSLTTTGADLPEGHVFHVDGAAASCAGVYSEQPNEEEQCPLGPSSR